MILWFGNCKEMGIFAPNVYFSMFSMFSMTALETPDLMVIECLKGYPVNQINIWRVSAPSRNPCVTLDHPPTLIPFELPREFVWHMIIIYYYYRPFHRNFFGYMNSVGFKLSKYTFCPLVFDDELADKNHSPMITDSFTSCLFPTPHR